MTDDKHSTFEIRRDPVETTRDGTLGGEPSLCREFVAGPSRYCINGVEVSQEEYERRAKAAAAPVPPPPQETT